ncbi:MAG TPA: aminotransferase class I/II-fold pyridoxal phosphate-dependent enzyme [Chitinophagaceae bacterium]|nr:aminotransferase class I/II-fold pyridoxal phosphate-dependent enzyme [Chitinophagaceae bacterium]
MQYEEFRKAGHNLIDYITDYLQQAEKKPLFKDVEPSFLNNLFDESIPNNPQSLEAIQKILEEKLLPYCTHVNHPGYMGLITPSPNPAGILGDLLAAALNQNLGAYSIGPSATAMELRVIRWLNDLIGYDKKAGGNLTSGGMMANFIGLKLARDFTTGDVAQYEGLHGKWAVYVSEERHVSIDKSVDAIGVGRNFLRALPTDDKFQIKIDALEEAIAKDKAEGIKILCIVGLAGTTNLGAVDDLEALHKIAVREKCWFHIDAAYGGGMLLSHKNKTLLNGIHLADSVTKDPHKWFYAPLDCGAVLVKDHDQLTRSFGIQHAYLTDKSHNERYQFYVHGFEQSKRFRSLKVWMSFQHYGKDKIGEWVDGNVAHAMYLHNLAGDSTDFESITQPKMSAICIRYKAEGLTNEELTKLHIEVAARIEKEGKFWFATTELKGKTYFRINPVNIHTTIETIDDLFGTLQAYCIEGASAISTNK